MKHLARFYTMMLLAVVASCIAATAVAQVTEPTPGRVLLNSSEITWGAAPASLPAGAQAAVIEGNPAEAGPFTLRLKLPANYWIAPHWHPGVEHVTVLAGTLPRGGWPKRASCS